MFPISSTIYALRAPSCLTIFISCVRLKTIYPHTVLIRYFTIIRLRNRYWVYRQWVPSDLDHARRTKKFDENFTGLSYFEFLPALRFSAISAAFRGKTISVV